ncbi:MAG: phosphoribosylamine--glycine ligase [Oscillospiraceae bacterium]|jgi:phosphoribosylamine--glycine ligase|nr:phosphoribosylamine--glycine ligase [Oscillospiraceae bacterium]
MKILVIGGGGREHAIVAALKKSAENPEIHAAPGNAGIALLASCHAVKATDVGAVVALAGEIKPEWVFVAPDDPLILGAVDALNAAGFKTFGPRKSAAAIEGSKKFSKNFMSRHNIPTAAYETFTDADKAVGYIKAAGAFPAVIKCDGPALGKGVIIAQNLAEAEEAVDSIMRGGKFGESGREIVVEEYLDGVEVTVLAFTDGETLRALPACTDHKRAFDGDKGPNTGGMGVIAPVPYYTDDVAAECTENIFIPTIRGLASEGRAFKGCIYFGLMLTASGAKVVEYNCRFGDPEAQTLLPLLETDLLDITRAVWEGRLSETDVRFSPRKAACVVMASGGYPEKYETGFGITGLDEAEKMSGVYVFHAGTRSGGGGFVTAGGRVLCVTAVGDDAETALNKAYDALGKIDFSNKHYRRDRGKKAALFRTL